MERMGAGKMRDFDPNKLFVQYRSGMCPATPVVPRRYTLTHSDATGDLFLTVGALYAWDRINVMRDEVLSEWRREGACVRNVSCVYLDNGEIGEEAAARRNEVFRRELPLALAAIRYGDRFLFDRCPRLDAAPIIVRFQSAYPRYARQEYWGTFNDYMTDDIGGGRMPERLNRSQ
ncbi:staygreen family protein [Cohnella ginsengisoli]|uniref:Staygreen family protein n=1 Tax=Cohnella ginsengisoli TaxID=425004 RepID=A0A9X4QQS0_9BACL|nr:staygreen family protein [Cohnella ginsengisoli]MDG0794030.1 staygreen family protein [Cohnella ginsengisoli]